MKYEINELLLNLGLEKYMDNAGLSKLYKLPEYYVFTIKKRCGGYRYNKCHSYRYIERPNYNIKEVQKRILKKLLNNVSQSDSFISDNAVAYVKGRKISDGASVHIGQKAVLKLDIKDFFRSIKFDIIMDNVFLKLCNDYDTAFLLTHLCTYNGHLPQGAPTSPIISNMVLFEFDKTVSSYCERKGINYTRYCDDMAFSGNFEQKTIVNFIKAELEKYGLRLNHKKTKLIRQGQRQTVTGIVVNEKMQLPKSYRKKIRQEVYYCKKFGVTSHIINSGKKEFITKTNEDRIREYLENLYGRVQYALQINPEDKEMQEYYYLLKDNVKKAKKHSY